MTAEAYSVAVKVSLLNHVTPGLLMISKGLAATGNDADRLNARLMSIGKQAAIGGAMLGGGLAIAGMFKGPINDALTYQREMSKLQQQGLGAGQIAEAQKFAEANKIIGTSLLDRVKLFTDAQGAFRESGMEGTEALHAAKTMMPVLAKYQVASTMLSDDKQGASHEQFMQLNKTVEIMGGLNDPKRAEEIANGIFKAVQSSGKMVSNRDLRLFMTQAGVAAVGLTDKAIFAGLEPIIAEFGGAVTGTGLQTAYSRAHGMMALTPSITTNEMLRLGIWQKDKVTRTKGGGARFDKGNPMAPGLAKLMDTDSVEFSKKMLEIYKSKGINSINDIGRENNILFGRTGGRIYTKIMQQIEVLEKSELAFAKSRGINQTVEDNKDAPTMKILQYHKALDDLSLAVGERVLPVFTPLIVAATNFAVEIARHPRLITGFTYALVGLSAFLIGGGLINMTIAAGRGFWLLAKAMLFLGGGAIAPLIPWLARMATYVVMFTASVSKGLLLLGRALFMTPIGLVVAGIAAAAYLLWNNWKEISGALKVMWGGIKAGFTKLFHGDILGALKTFAHVWLLGWQTIFNTLIAGLNTVLPEAYQLSKTHFADDFNAKGDKKPGWSPLVAPVPAKAAGGDTQQINLYVDGKKISDVVIQRMAKEAAKPQTGTQGFDPTRSPMRPGAPSAAYARG